MGKLLKYGEFFGSTIKRADFHGLKLTETSYKPQSYLPRHIHEYAYLCLVIRGSYTEKSGTGEIECSAGEIIAHPAGHSHSDRFFGNDSVCFNIELKDELFEKFKYRPELKVIKKLGNISYKKFAVKLYKEFSNSSGSLNLMLEEIVLSILNDLKNEKDFTGKDNAKLKIAEEFLYENFNNNPSLTEIAGYLEIHPVYLARLFKSVKGITISDYLRGVKIQKACYMLVNKNYSLPQIALDCGFFDQSHFNKVFKNYTGVTPLEYRKIFS